MSTQTLWVGGRKYAHSYTEKKSAVFFRTIEDNAPDTIPTNTSRKGCGIILFQG